MIKQKRSETLGARISAWLKLARLEVVKDVFAKVGFGLLPTSRQKRYLVNRGDGRAIIAYAYVAKAESGCIIELLFQHKITSQDFDKGKLLPTCFSLLSKKRKRITGVEISLESAKDLHQLLGQILNDRDRPGQQTPSIVDVMAYVNEISDRAELTIAKR